MYHAFGWGVEGEYRILVEKPDGKNHLEDPGVDGKIILTLRLPNLFLNFSTPCM
jgi:hypothetical protein